jgi:hypothetical protein
MSIVLKKIVVIVGGGCSSNSSGSRLYVTFPFCCLIKLLDVDPQDQGEEDGAVVDLDSQRKGKCAVIKTSTRQVRILADFLPNVDVFCVEN